jgi:hypothetical protein
MELANNVLLYKGYFKCVEEYSAIEYGIIQQVRFQKMLSMHAVHCKEQGRKVKRREVYVLGGASRFRMCPEPLPG